MKQFFRYSLALVMMVLVSACADDTQIFPDLETSLNESSVVLANPISLAVNEDRSEIYVANSNVDIFYEQGSLARLEVDASNPAAPTLSASQILEVPNYAGEIYFDGDDQLFATFRENSTVNEGNDFFIEYQFLGENLSESDRVEISENPFGFAFDGTNFYVASEDTLSIVDLSLNLVAEIDMTTAQDAEIDDSSSTFIEDVVVDTNSSKALVSNRGGQLFVVGLTSRRVLQVIDGLESTRDMLIDANDTSRVFVIDSRAETIVVIDFDLLTTPSATPELIDNSEVVVATIGVGNDPNGLVMDAANNRLYVCNSLDNTISVIDTVSLNEIARVSVDEDDVASSFVRGVQVPIALALGTFDDEQYLFVAGFESNSIAMIRTSTLEVVEIYPNNDLFYEEDEDD